MRVEYRTPNIIDKLDEAIENASKEGKKIDNIRLSTAELGEFCETTGMAFNRQMRYTYKHYIIAYDWNE